MKEIWRKHKFSIVIAAFILAVGLAAYSANRFLVGKIIEKADKTQELIIDNQLNKKRIEKIPEMENANEEYEKDRESLDVVLNPSGNVDFIRSLESLAESTGNKISLKIEDGGSETAKSQAKTVKKKEKDGEKGGIVDSLAYDKYLKMQISLEGGYVELVNFIRKLENAKYYVNVISFDAKKSEERKDSEVGIGNIFTPGSPEAGRAKTREIIKSEINIIVYKEE